MQIYLTLGCLNTRQNVAINAYAREVGGRRLPSRNGKAAGVLLGTQNFGMSNLTTTHQFVIAQPPSPPTATPCHPGYRPRASPSRYCPSRTKRLQPPPRLRRSSSLPSKDALRFSPHCRTTRARTIRRFGVVAVQLQARERREGVVKRVSMLTEKCLRALREDRRHCQSQSRRGGGGNTTRTY
jgi:hypothetical protein